MNKNRLNAFCIIASLILTGCAASPGLKAVISEKETIKETDEIQNAKMAWLGRYLLEPSARKKALEILSKERLPDTWNAHDYATLAAMTTDVAVGQLGSSEGSDLGSAVFVLGLLAGDGSEDLVSGIYLPAQLDGQVLETPELARQAALSMVKQNVYNVAEDLGFVVNCIYDCEGFSPIYRFDVSENPSYSFDCFYSCGTEGAKFKLLAEPFKGKFVYQPSPFTINISIGEFEDAGDTRNIDSLSSGFPVKWKSKGVNGALVQLRDNVAVNADGIIEIMPSKNNASHAWVNGWDNHLNTPFGRHIYRIMLNNPYHYYGSSRNSMFVYNSNIYNMTRNSMYNSLNTIVTN